MKKLRIMATPLRLLVLSLAFTGVELALAQSSETGNGNAERLSVTTQLTRMQRDQGIAGSTSESKYEALLLDGNRDDGKRSSTLSKTGGSESSAPNMHFWFYTADVELFNDHDGDGFFQGIDLLFDADTVYNYAEVYAVVYLSLEGGPWNEYAATEVFALSGASADDEYIIVTELISGYPSGSYDLLIELFDAIDDSFVASFGPNDTPELAFLPLEDAERDTPRDTTIIVTEHGGGSLDLLAILMLAGIALLAELRQKRAQQAVVRVELPSHAAEKIEPVGIGLKNGLGARRSGLAD